VTASIISILPLSDEVNALKCYSSPANLDQASKLYYYICRIPRLVTRLDCHEIAFSWQNFSKQVSQQIDIILKACAEIENCKSQMQTVLSIVLALGNYLNSDTKFGNAHGFKLEAINKLEALKASKSTNGSMIHILANLVTDHAVDVFAISQSWTAIPSAANMSLQQTMCDVTKLEQQVNKMNQEFIRIKDAQENIGLDGVLESCKGVVTFPLHRRLNEFLISAKPKIAVIKSDMKTIEKTVASILGAYGERFSLDGDEDTFKRFFSSIFVFFRSLRTAADENLKRRKAQEKAANLEQEQRARAARKEANNTSNVNSNNISKSSSGGNSVENKSILNRDIFASPSPFSKGKLCGAPTRVKPRRLQLDIPKENNNNFANVSNLSINISGSITGDEEKEKTSSEAEDSIAPLRKKRSGMLVNLPGTVGAAGLSSPRSRRRVQSDASCHNAQGKRQSPRGGSNTCNSPRHAVMSPRMQRDAFKDF